jgi:hypothetical protein
MDRLPPIARGLMAASPHIVQGHFPGDDPCRARNASRGGGGYQCVYPADSCNQPFGRLTGVTRCSQFTCGNAWWLQNQGASP